MRGISKLLSQLYIAYTLVYQTEECLQNPIKFPACSWPPLRAIQYYSFGGWSHYPLSLATVTVLNIRDNLCRPSVGLLSSSISYNDIWQRFLFSNCEVEQREQETQGETISLCLPSTPVTMLLIDQPFSSPDLDPQHHSSDRSHFAPPPSAHLTHSEPSSDNLADHTGRSIP